MRRTTVIAVLFCLWLPNEAIAHDLQYSVSEATAVSVRLFFADGNEFTFEAYEIYRAGEEIPFQVGRTDAQGRLAFLPDRPGAWRIKVFSEDGHGIDFSLTTGARGTVEEAGTPRLDRYSRIIVGVSLILGIFGLINLFARHRRMK